jgi:hypothetical protein
MKQSNKRQRIHFRNMLGCVLGQIESTGGANTVVAVTGGELAPSFCWQPCTLELCPRAPGSADFGEYNNKINMSQLATNANHGCVSAKALTNSPGA